MILVGTLNLSRTRQTGRFYCPTCGSEQDYRLRARRPFLTVYFVPVVPIGAAEPFVECAACREKWDPSVLEMNRQKHQAVQEDQFRQEALRSAVLVVIEDGIIRESEIKALRELAFRLFDLPLDREELGELCSIVQHNRIKTSNYVLTVSRRWSHEQRLMALQAMFLAATPDGFLTPSRSVALTQMRDILELTNREYQTAIETALRSEVMPQ